MQDRRRERRVERAGTVVAAGDLCSTDLLRAPEQSSPTDHSRRAPTAVQRKTSCRNTHWRKNLLSHKITRQKTIQSGGQENCDQTNTEGSVSAFSWMNTTSRVHRSSHSTSGVHLNYLSSDSFWSVEHNFDLFTVSHTGLNFCF